MSLSTSFNSPTSSTSTSTTTVTPTHRVLSLYYPELTTLSSLFNPKDKLLKEKDSERFKTFLQECLVGCVEPDGLSLGRKEGEWKVLEREDSMVGMSEVSTNYLLSLLELEFELICFRNFVGKILNQVLQRIFNSHAKEYETLRSQGLPAYTTPKNVLAAGKRLVRSGTSTVYSP